MITVNKIIDPTFPVGWYIVTPQSIQLELSDTNRPIACFEFEKHAVNFAERWSSFVQITKNGNNT